MSLPNEWKVIFENLKLVLKKVRMNTLNAAGLGSAKERGGGALETTLFTQMYTRKSIRIGLLVPRPADVEETGIR